MRPGPLTLSLLLALAACSSGGQSGTGGAASTASTTTTTTTTNSATATGGTGGAATTTSGTSTGGTGTGGTGTGGVGTGGTAAFVLTSTAFSEGAEIPPKHACSGANVSPDLHWTPGPAGAQSYAIVFTDQSNNLIHWVIWDIPSTVVALPEDVEKTANPAVPAGAKQVKSYNNSTYGYLGPCPPSMHTYQFVVHALDVAALPNVTTSSTRAEVNTEIMAHDLGSAALTGTFTP